MRSCEASCTKFSMATIWGWYGNVFLVIIDLGRDMMGLLNGIVVAIVSCLQFS